HPRREITAHAGGGESDCGPDCSLHPQHRFLGRLRAARQYDPDFRRQEYRLAHFWIRDAIYVVSGRQSDVYLFVCARTDQLLGVAVEAAFRTSQRNEDGHWLRSARVVLPCADVYR